MAIYGMLFAYPIMIIPSFIYSLIMEKLIRKKIGNTLFYFCAAAALGWFASLLLTIIGPNWLIFTFHSVIGILVGVFTALILRRIGISEICESGSEGD